MNIDVHGILDQKLTAADIIGRGVSILGVRGSGKSNTAAVLMEELLADGVPIAVIDTDGEYYTLKERYDITVVGAPRYTKAEIAVTMKNVEQVAEASYVHGRSIIFDVSGITYKQARGELVLAYLSRIWSLSALHRIPLVIFVEEAQNWMPQSGVGTRSESGLSTKDVLADIASQGRKLGLSLVIIGQRSARIDKDSLTQSEVCFLHLVRHPSDMKVYIDMIPREPAWTRERVSKLRKGEALVIIDDQIVKCTMRLRHTTHVGATPTLDSVPAATQMSLLELMTMK